MMTSNEVTICRENVAGNTLVMSEDLGFDPISDLDELADLDEWLGPLAIAALQLLDSNWLDEPMSD